MSRVLAILALAAALVTAQGCMLRHFTLKPYRLDIQQGNFLNEEDLEQIKPGMTRTQVRFLLGTPIVTDAFNDNRWDYVYYYKPGRGGETFMRHFTVYFEGDTAVRVVRDTDTPGPSPESGIDPGAEPVARLDGAARRS